MRYQGFVVEVINDELVLVDTGGQLWRIIASKEIARLGGHRCQFQNASVTFDFDGKRVTDFTTELPKHNGEQEISTVTFVKHVDTPSAYGFMQRNDCGCSLAFHFSEVVTYGEVLVGVDCRHRVGRVDGRAVAVEIELFVPAVKIESKRRI
jgi:hypothetical protein